MNIARPAGGFRMSLTAEAQASVEQAAQEFAGFRLFWSNIMDRLRFTAHLEGSDIRPGAGDRVFAAAADDVRGVPRTLVAYHVLGDQVRIKAVLFTLLPDIMVVREDGAA